MIKWWFFLENYFYHRHSKCLTGQIWIPMMFFDVAMIGYSRYILIRKKVEYKTDKRETFSMEKNSTSLFFLFCYFSSFFWFINYFSNHFNNCAHLVVSCHCCLYLHKTPCGQSISRNQYRSLFIQKTFIHS